MSEMDERREAGRNIRRAYEFLLATHNSIAQIFRSADQILSERQPPWLSNYKGASWNNSSSIDYPDKWIPRFFTRAWTRTEENGRWKRALAFYVSEYGEEVIEPWMGCFLVEAVRDDGFDETGAGQWWNWAWRLAEPSSLPYAWLPDLKDRAFGWTEPKDKTKLPVRACGYFLRLTDIGSIDDLRRLAIEPLLALDEGWDPTKLPKDLPNWA